MDTTVKLGYDKLANYVAISKTALVVHRSHNHLGHCSD